MVGVGVMGVVMTRVIMPRVVPMGPVGCHRWWRRASVDAGGLLGLTNQRR
tara:strand:+ start:333 stop:482 length:150 start_codon:yes stop_codon:yes gene_type:complete